MFDDMQRLNVVRCIINPEEQPTRTDFAYSFRESPYSFDIRSNK